MGGGVETAAKRDQWHKENKYKSMTINASGTPDKEGKE